MGDLRGDCMLKLSTVGRKTAFSTKLQVITIIFSLSWSLNSIAKISNAEADEEPKSRKVTIVFLVDASWSMKNHTQRVSSGTDEFIKQFEEQKCSDWEVGIGRLDAVTGPSSYWPPKQPALIKRSSSEKSSGKKYTKDIDVIKERFAIIKETDGNQDEVPVDAIDYLLESEGDYFQTRDYTAIIVVSDALEFASKATVNDVVRKIQNLGNGQAGVYELGVDPNLIKDESCKIDHQFEGDATRTFLFAKREAFEAEYKRRNWRPPFSVEEIAKKTGGTFIHMCAEDMEAKMRELASSIAKEAKCTRVIAQRYQPEPFLHQLPRPQLFQKMHDWQYFDALFGFSRRRGIAYHNFFLQRHILLEG